MYKPGHVGAALLAYAPVGWVLVVSDRFGLAAVGGAAMVALAMLPDYDMRVPFVQHRGVTHTVGFAVAVGAVLGSGGLVLARRLPDVAPPALAVFGFGVGTLAVLSHVGADALTPAGVTPFWPLSDWHVTLGLVRADNTVANYLLLALGVFATVVAILIGVRAGVTF